MNAKARSASIVMFGLLVSLTAFAQSDAKPKPLQFDVVSIKENRSGEERGLIQILPQGDRVTVSNVAMYRIVEMAFNLQREAPVSGAPQWTYNQRWDIEAKVAPADLEAFHALSFEQKETLLQQILVDRCRMTAHVERKDAPVYTLTVAKGGMKMRSEKPERDEWDTTGKRGELHARGVPMQALIYNLTFLLPDRPIVDQTGLAATYSFDLLWTPAEDLEQDNGAGAQHPSLFKAMEEQLGLRLAATKAMVAALVLDHIEKPTAN